jgi:hypothetical protein
MNINDLFYYYQLSTHNFASLTVYFPPFLTLLNWIGLTGSGTEGYKMGCETFCQMGMYVFFPFGKTLLLDWYPLLRICTMVFVA